MYPRPFLVMPGAFMCCIRVSGSHLAESVVKSDLSVVTVDCLMTFVRINWCACFSQTAACW